ncbi:hypothetical protein Anapl_06745 [Anas platyrhynchos]|uniref:Uncharacterized protein n=1 Tax=Anas platyrhynchos TaxID=8839 RepID=R0M539_ANAPL|nr:hypothetical protein Anapl_06745 [Anas platyrhynchos]
MSGANDQSTSGKTFIQQQPYHTAVGNCLGKLRSSTGGARGTWHTPELGDVLCVLGTQKQSSCCSVEALTCIKLQLHLVDVAPFSKAQRFVLDVSFTSSA